MPPNDHFTLLFGYFLYSFPQLVLSSSIRLARIDIFANDHPRTKLGFDNFPLFTYLLIENEKVGKDKDTIFILAISLSDRPLAETHAVKLFKRRSVRGIRYIKHDAILPPQRHWTEDSKKIGTKMQEKALGFSWALG